MDLSTKNQLATEVIQKRTVQYIIKINNERSEVNSIQYNTELKKLLV